MKRSAFTLIDFIAGIAALAVLLYFSIAATSSLDTRMARIKCASNLRQIGQAILLYCNDSKGPYPRTKYDPAQADRPTAFTAVNSPDPFAVDCPQTNDATGGLYLLRRVTNLSSNIFICPSSGLKPDDIAGGSRMALSRSNFASPQSLSYSYADPYPNAAAAKAGYDLNLVGVKPIDPGFAIAADINPGTAELTQLSISSSAEDMRKGNSPNHSSEGQNVLFADGHVEFQNNPFCGVKQDNIYTYGPSGADQANSGGMGIWGSPVGPDDSLLLPALNMPAAEAAPPPAAPVAAAPPPPVDQGTDFTLYAGISAGIFLLILLAALAAVVLRKRKPTEGVSER